MLFFRTASSVALVVGLGCALARAQPASEVSPPVVKNNTDVPYPAGGEGDAQVVLELVVEKDGSVSRATVVEGAAPFAEPARARALTWHFEPAERDHVAVAARIRARVAFHRDDPPPAAATSAAAAANADAASTPSPAAGPPRASSAPSPLLEAVEITVTGARHEIGQTTLSSGDVRQMPGAFGDAFRAIDALPGVMPLASGLPYFYTRGAPPNNAGYFIDGVRVPLLFHLGLAQSVLHPGLIDHVDFFPSAAPASYGGFAGAIIAGQTRAPKTSFHGEANLRLVDVGALVETPFANGRGNALVAGRYGYPGPILSLVTDDPQIGYSDYQTRVSWKLSDRDTIGAFAFGSHDYLGSHSPSGDPVARKQMQERFVSDTHRVDLRYDHALRDGRLRFALTGGYDRQGAQPTYATNESLAARLEIDQTFSEKLRFRGGANARLEDYRLRITAQGPGEPAVPQSADPPPANLSAGVYADVVWRIAPSVEVVPGVRFDAYSSSRPNASSSSGTTKTLVPAIDPRLSTRVTLAPSVAWLSSFGLSHQYPSLRVGDVPGPLLSVPGFPFGDRQLQTAAQVSQGVEIALPAAFTLSATAFYSAFWGLTDLGAMCFQLMRGTMPRPEPGAVVPPYVCPNNDPVRGKAYGIELMLRRPLTERLTGWLSYTLSRSTRQAHFLTPTGADELANVVSEFDRTHVLNLILGYDLGRRWRAGSRFLFYTGTPYSKLDGSLPIPPYNAYRNPAFYRVDVRLEKSWRLGENGSIAFVLEGQNVTLRKEVSGLGLECKGNDPSGGNLTTTCEQSTTGPLAFPSVGVEAFF